MMLSKYFSKEELKCKGINCCGGVYAVQRDLLNALDLVRELSGHPIYISSGFRCFAHNENIQGAPLSQHCVGRGVDVYSKVLSIEELLKIIKSIHTITGVGVYDDWIHIDTRKGGAIWDLRTTRRRD